MKMSMAKVTYIHKTIVLLILLAPSTIFANGKIGAGTKTLQPITNESNFPNKGYFQVQVLVTISKDKAIINMAKLILAGFLDARFEEFKGINGKTYYRVFAGDFLNKSQASIAKNKINEYKESYNSVILNK